MTFNIKFLPFALLFSVLLVSACHSDDPSDPSNANPGGATVPTTAHHCIRNRRLVVSNGCEWKSLCCRIRKGCDGTGCNHRSRTLAQHCSRGNLRTIPPMVLHSLLVEGGANGLAAVNAITGATVWNIAPFVAGGSVTPITFYTSAAIYNRETGEVAYPSTSGHKQ